MAAAAALAGALAGCAARVTGSGPAPGGYLAEGPTVALRETRPPAERSLPEALWDLEVQVRREREENERLRREIDRLDGALREAAGREAALLKDLGEARTRAEAEAGARARLESRERTLLERLLTARLRALALEEERLLREMNGAPDGQEASAPAGPGAPAQGVR